MGWSIHTGKERMHRLSHQEMTNGDALTVPSWVRKEVREAVNTWRPGENTNQPILRQGRPLAPKTRA